MYKSEELKKILKNKKVLLTGHTGFKGAYTVFLLNELGAKVYGYSNEILKGSLYEILKLRNMVVEEKIDDIRNLESLKKFVIEVNPDYIIHMAAQPIVIDAYDDPVKTYETNVMGTVNILEVARGCSNLISLLNVTTDKVYKNDNIEKYKFVEDDKLCGYDPYSNSKSCSEIVTFSYRNSFFKNSDVKIFTARAGNVIGAGDISPYRILPDCYRAYLKGEDILIRNKYSTRPYQYVLEPLMVYLNILLNIDNNQNEYSFNVGPDESFVTTVELVDKFCKYFNEGNDEKAKNLNYVCEEDLNKEKKKNEKEESKFLSLDNSLIRRIYGYKQIYTIDEAINITAKGYKKLIFSENSDILGIFDDGVKDLLSRIDTIYSI